MTRNNPSLRRRPQTYLKPSNVVPRASSSLPLACRSQTFYFAGNDRKACLKVNSTEKLRKPSFGSNLQGLFARSGTPLGESRDPSFHFLALICGFDLPSFAKSFSHSSSLVCWHCCLSSHTHHTPVALWPQATKFGLWPRKKPRSLSKFKRVNRLE